MYLANSKPEQGWKTVIGEKGDRGHGCWYHDFYLWHVEFCAVGSVLFHAIQDGYGKVDEGIVKK